MRWEDERYVRVYTRDTADWLCLSFEAQGLMTLILRKVDRAGILPLGRHGKKAVAIAIGHANRWEALAPALEELLADGCVRIEGDTLLLPNFIEAQEAAQSDAQRKRESRAKARDVAASPVTFRDQKSQPVTSGHNLSQVVTPSRAVPSVPSRAEPVLAGDVVAPPDPVSAFSGMPVQQVLDGAQPDRRADASPMRKAKPEKPPGVPEGMRLKALTLMLVADYAEKRDSEKYLHGGAKDAEALKRIIAAGVPDPEIRARWRFGLTAKGWLNVSTFAQLGAKWNDLAGYGDPPVEARGDPPPSRLNRQPLPPLAEEIPF